MKLLWRIIKGIVTLFLVVVLLLVLFQKITNNKVVIGNIYIFQIASDSMTPQYKIGDVIVVKKVSPDTLKVGDDVTYLGTSSNLRGLVITHRIINVSENENKKYFITKGLANQIEDPQISEDDIYGKVIYQTVVFSFVGRLMTNIVVYYLLFVCIGLSFAYEVVSSFFVKEDDE